MTDGRKHGLVFYGRETEGYALYYISRGDMSADAVKLTREMPFTMAAAMVHALNLQLFEQSEADDAHSIEQSVRKYLIEHAAQEYEFGCLIALEEEKL